MAAGGGGGARGPRTALASRADPAARLLLSHMEFLDTLAHDDHAALCALPAPHGPLFAWLEAQFHEHGVRPWEQLQTALHGHGSAVCAERVMTGAHAQTGGELRELREETGVEAEMLGLVDVVDGLFPEHGRHYVLIDYAAEWTGGEPVAGDDATEAAFMSVDTALTAVAWSETRRVIREAVEMRVTGGSS